MTYHEWSPSDGEIGQICDDCGAVVGNTELHDTHHAALNLMLKAADYKGDSHA